jgi:uncharacterized protein (DUF433 family)
MTIRGHVENGRILLDEPVPLPEGAQVHVEVGERPISAAPVLTSGAAPAEINKTPGVSGGAACVRDSRIPVWTLVQLKKLGRSESQLLSDFPSLTRFDLDAVWSYYREHPIEIDEAIAAQEDED